jgi:hypothetical protein
MAFQRFYRKVSDAHAPEIPSTESPGRITARAGARAMVRFRATDSLTMRRAAPRSTGGRGSGRTGGSASVGTGERVVTVTSSSESEGTSIRCVGGLTLGEEIGVSRK